MTPVEKITIERVIGSTESIVDRHKCLAAIAYAEKRGCRKEAIKMIMAARFSYINWLTTTQRKWQSMTKNPNKAMHHDSIKLREKYVRCNL